jgi:hypothetical protein
MKQAEDFSQFKARLLAMEPRRQPCFTPGGEISLQFHLAAVSYWMDQSDGWHRQYRTAVYQVITLCVIGGALMVALAVTLACLVLR